MHQPVSIKEYNAILNSARRSGPEVQKHYAHCMHILISRWAARVNSHQLAILMFVFDRTFYHAKMSETVVFDQFLNGMLSTRSDEMVFCGLTISPPTLMKQLKELADMDFLHVRSCVSADGKHEIKARLYAINCKRLFNLDLADEENPMILREPKKKKHGFATHEGDEVEVETARNVLKTPRKVRVPPSKNPPQSFEGIYIYNTDTKVSNIGGASLAEPSPKVDVSTRLAEVRQQRLDAAQARSKSRPATTGMRALRSIANTPYSKANVQKLFDGAMGTYYPTLPRIVVTEKPLGVLKKRMATAAVDLGEFINWAVQFWATTAASHERAARRRAGENSKYAHQPLPAAPDFTTLSYRFPYFVACYRSHLTTESAGLATTREQVLERTVEKLQRQVAAVKQDAAGAQQRERNLRRKVRAAPQEEPEEAPQRAPAARVAPTRIKRTAPAARSPIDIEDDIPAWDDFPIKNRTAK